MEKAIMILILEIELKTGDYSIQIMVEIGIVEIFGMGTPLGIIGTMFIVLYFSRKQAQGFTVDIETKVLNDLDEKVRKMAEIIIEKPSMQKVMYKLEKLSEELAFAYYILFILSHVYSMHQRKVLKGDEWKQTESENWFDPSFQEFVNKELIPGTQKNNGGYVSKLNLIEEHP